MHRIHKRRLPLFTLVLALLVPTVIVAASGGAGAVDPTGNFELDGNIVPTVKADWQNTTASPHNGFFDATHSVNPDGSSNPVSPLPSPFAKAAFVRDFFPGSTQNSVTTTKDFTTFTNGSSDTNDIGTWKCVGVNNVTDKGDITNAYTAAYRDTATGHLIVYFGIEKNSSNGDNNVAIWLLKDGTVGCNSNGTTGGSGTAFSGHHQNGDTLLAAAFTNGGATPTIKQYEWIGGPLGHLDTANANTGTKCGSSTNPNLCAITNLNQQLTPPWPTWTKFGSGVPSLQFYEGGADLTALTGEKCFARFLANTRASQSETSALYDFATQSFPTCNPGTIMTASPTTANPEVAVAGQNVTFSWTEKNDGDVQLTNVRVVTDNSACNTALTPASVTLDPGQQQVFSCTIATPSTVGILDIVGTGHGDSPLGDVTFCPDPSHAPPNTTCDQDEQATARAVTIKPGSEMHASASPTIVHEGDPVTFTITEANAGSAPAGFESFLDLANNTITASSATAGVAADCQNELASPVSGDSGTPGIISAGETWTYKCTVTAPTVTPPNTGFSITFDGSGTALTGSPHRVTVDFAFDSRERASADVTVIHPSTELTVTGNAVITYTFNEHNNSADAPLTPPTPGNRESVITASGTPLDMCNVSPVAYQSGDLNNDKILGVDETWVYTCQGSLAGPLTDAGSTSESSAGVGAGVDATGTTITKCPVGGCPTAGEINNNDERDSIVVTITNNARG
jgi:uncharacterized repeat protein (TIGR01451 family)